jgi:hypothetical protein
MKLVRHVSELRQTITEVMEKIREMAPDAEKFITAYQTMTFDYPECNRVIASQRIPDVREYGRTLFALMNDLKDHDPFLAPLMVEEIKESIFKPSKNQAS